MPPDGHTESIDRTATARVFFGLWPSPELAGQLAGIAGTMAGQFGGRPTRQDTIHLTLVFLGDVPESQLTELCEIASHLQPEPFDLCLDQLGIWRHNHLLWAGCSAPPPALGRLVGDLHAALKRGGFAVEGRERQFMPHVTLVRKLPKDAIANDGHRLPAIGALHWPCAHFVLIRSRLGVSGSSYQTVAEFPCIA